MMINLLLSGGSGTRLWPLSRTLLPKQFVRLFDQKSLFQQTLLRNESVCSRTMVIANTEHLFLAADQVHDVLGSTGVDFLLEPIGRNTAPAIALACMLLDEDDVVLVTPSDHLIRDTQAYAQAVEKAKALAQQGDLVTFGISPAYAETGFGYIHAQGHNVLAFVEKPDAATAQIYVDAGDYYWNSGMFCFKVGVLLAELAKHSPDVFQACERAKVTMSNAHNVTKIDLDSMMQIPDISLDYAVMEKSSCVKVVPCDLGWSDLGSFDALYDEVKKPAVDNAVLARHEQAPEPICLDATDNLLVTRDRQIALIDVHDLLVIDTADALLIAQKGSSQKIKQVVAQVKQRTPELTEVHRVAHRPWGAYEVLVTAEQYKVKRIVVKPKSQLSLQKHFHRNEHWIVVSGTATVTVDDHTFLVRPNESTYIQMGQIHRLENQGKIDLVMIEVQVGEYTGEDDIVRLDDRYGR